MTQEIPDVGTASLQEIFDYVVTNLLKQNAKSSSEKHPDECLYRGPGGKKCAAGFLIPDDKYSSECEGSSIYDSMEWIIPNFNDYNIEHIRKRELISNMQEIHDEYEIENWKNAFVIYANEHGLAINFS